MPSKDLSNCKKYLKKPQSLTSMTKLILLCAGLVTIAACTASKQTASSKSNGPRYKIAVVDLMILKRQKLGAFQLTKDIGADGVEIDMGGLGSRETFDNQLAKDSIRQQFLDKAAALNLEISSLGMTGFYAQSFPE